VTSPEFSVQESVVTAAQETLPQEGVIQLGPVKITAKYPEVDTLQDERVPDLLARMYGVLAGSGAPLPSAAAGLDPMGKRWLLYALLLLVSNRDSLGGFDYATAAKWLAGNVAALEPIYQPRARGKEFEVQVLGRTGWLGAALRTAVTPAGRETQEKMSALYSAPGHQPGALLDRPVLEKIVPPLEKALIAERTAWLGERDHQPIEDLRFIADFIQAATWQVFKPYAAGRADSPFVTGLKYRDRLYDKTAAMPTEEQLIGYLVNRANVVGSDSTSGPSLFVQAGYDAARTADREALEQLLQTWLDRGDKRRGLIAFLVQHTGSNSHGLGGIGMVTEFRPNVAKGDWRWRNIRTMIHELMHSLIHPYLVAEALKIQAPQVIGEGFIEVMTRELYNELVGKMTTGAAGKLQFGIDQQDQTVPARTEAGYGQAGKAAADIFGLAGRDSFLTAFFVGATDLVAVPA